MLLTKLKPKMIIKNYKELCSLLEEPVLGGDSKQAQLKEWSRYFKFHKQRSKQSIIIDEIYEAPLLEITAKTGRKPIYQEHLAKVLINYLLSQNGYTKNLTSLNWYKVLGLINDKYKNSTFIEIKQQNKNIKDQNIETFYQICNKKLHSIFFSVLTVLKRNNIIDYTELTYVKYKNQSITKIADEACLECIEYAKQEALNIIGINDLSELYQLNNFDEYNGVFHKQLLDLYNITYIYKKIKVTYINDSIDIILSHDVIENERLEANLLLRNYINNSADNFQNKLDEEYENRLMFGPNHYAESQKAISKYLLQIQKRRESIYDWRWHVEENKNYVDLRLPNLVDDNVNTQSAGWYSPKGIYMPNLSTEELRNIKPIPDQELNLLFKNPLEIID